MIFIYMKFIIRDFIRKIIEESFNNKIELPEFLYHATYRPLLKKIEQEGLGGKSSKKKWSDSKKGVVYLALDPYVAESYAESVDIDEFDLPEDWLDKIVILKINTSNLDRNKFNIDQNVLDNQGDTLEYDGIIPWSAIEKFNLNINESDPKVGTGKKPKGSGRRLYTDENPKDTVSVKFRTKEDIVDTLNKASFKSKSHKRQSQIINLIHQRVRAAYQNAKDPETKSRLKRAFDYIESRKEKSKEKTKQLQKEIDNSQNLDEKCWKGYEKKGTKTMYGKKYPNCVKK